MNKLFNIIERIKIFFILCIVPITCVLLSMCYILHLILAIICITIDVCLIPIYLIIWIFTGKFYFDKFPDVILERSFTNYLIQNI